MLKLILGAVNSTKSKEFNKEVKNACLNGEDVIVIVPDQYSFEYDKELYNEVGAKAFNSMEVIAFNRLCEKIVKQVGGVSGDFADENARLICMFYAVSLFQKSGSARHFKKALYKTGFCKEMIELVDELRLSGVDSTSLREAGALKGESLEDKTNDLADIFELYTSELEKRGLKDNSSLQSEAVKAARSSHYFKNKTVFIHEFSDFSHDEYDLITIMLNEAKSCVVSLIEGNGENSSSNFSPFKTTFDTKSNLIRIAKSMGSEVSVLKADGSLFESHAIEHISNNIFCHVKKEYSGSTDSVEVVRAKSMYEEAEYVAAKISELCKQGYSYKDIAIFTRQIGEYYPIIESVFERYDIPVFGHTSQSAMMSPLAVYVTSIFDCVMTGEFRTENILRYIKSPLSKISEADACALEEYVYKWGVDRSLWEKDFTGASTESEKELSHINQIRRKAISPLVKFKENSKGKTADEICLALNELFNDIHLSDRAFSILSKSMESGDAELLETAREFKQIWRMFLSSINSVFKY
ncbi:MAG: exodeoxyribonuclease V subunit gamma, partial [Ruminococcus sp.]|nr:exodeoxyribonuclease V subunit gamma [Ruminococcus sp.]